ncbi:MAG: hypothetical protein AAF721_10140, partial [Myxococcota bacterium]
MLTLDEALALLADDDVDEIIIQSGQAVRTLKGFNERAVPGDALTASEIVGILQAAQLQQIVPRHDTAGEEHTQSVDGCEYRFRIARFLDLIELRISLAHSDDVAVDGGGALGSGEATVIVTPPKGARRAAKPVGRVGYQDPLPAPTRHPIGTEDPTVPLAIDGAKGEKPTRREPSVKPAAEPSASPTRRDTPADAEKPPLPSPPDGSDRPTRREASPATPAPAGGPATMRVTPAVAAALTTPEPEPDATA